MEKKLEGKKCPIFKGDSTSNKTISNKDISDNLDISRIDDITESDINRLNRYKAALKLLGT